MTSHTSLRHIEQRIRRHFCRKPTKKHVFLVRLHCASSNQLTTSYCKRLLLELQRKTQSLCSSLFFALHHLCMLDRYFIIECTACWDCWFIVFWRESAYVYVIYSQRSSALNTSETPVEPFRFGQSVAHHFPSSILVCADNQCCDVRSGLLYTHTHTSSVYDLFALCSHHIAKSIYISRSIQRAEKLSTHSIYRLPLDFRDFRPTHRTKKSSMECIHCPNTRTTPSTLYTQSEREKEKNEEKKTVCTYNTP